MILSPLIALLLIQSSFAFLEDSYPDNGDTYNSYPDDVPDTDNDIEVHRRSNHFLRFGRNNGNGDNNDGTYEDYEEYARPTRKTEKNDHFIRFGRSRQQDFLRFGRDPRRSNRDKSMYLRFGRSMAEESTPRTKRETFPEDLQKRSDAFLRFGRNSNFMRFGRNPANILSVPAMDATAHSIYKQDPTLIRLLAHLMARKQDDKHCASAV